MALPPGGGVPGAIVGGPIGASKGAQVDRAVGAVSGGVRRVNYRADQRAAALINDAGDTVLRLSPMHAPDRE